mmetsp:Transcript_133986/g.199276  ORF Transcript_133986/g.199276 Transcript_133986/m.199276 type:complete len:512 (+) Transcript_133986:121-1656(+)|eukprot:CAMPEP_0117004158 /NCGR_PEP_ID=MMETSP0472-20121206/5237_1 /TAXON_ID=693140 ORGANISM="Tiarina fusus, Strain LIS" /NCGR_SAMPLE_ID=MMETSP0472 /ASSEMBLY_ACC=CAM_ASM_000603 /LENGTH=511 /DNA_ID=CAMNT_0004705045 /DNA_START=121 /DNA_END=1656 /DNA_ORIENTATION=+
MKAKRSNRLGDIIFKRNKKNTPCAGTDIANQQPVTFRFSGIGPNGVFYQSIPDNNNGTAAAFGTDIMLREPNHAQIFNDYPIYKMLRDTPGCGSVKIAAVRARFLGCSACHGIQVLYKSTFEDGRTHMMQGAVNGARPGESDLTMANWTYLDDNEHMTGLRLNQDDEITGIIFVTNLREIRFGGRGREDGLSVATHGRRSTRLVSTVVAIAGTTTTRALQRMAYYVKPILVTSDGFDSCGGAPTREEKYGCGEDELSFYFSGTSGMGATCVTAAQSDAEEIGDNIMRYEPNNERTFNYFALYKELSGQPGCKRVEISSIRVYHHKSLYIKGLEVTYMCSFADGRTTYVSGSQDRFKQRGGFFPFNLSHKRDEYSTIDLAAGEYITGLDVVQGVLISGMAVHTNYRKFHCGRAIGDGRMLIETPTPRDSMRLVALAGTYCREGALQRVGHYSEATGAWAILGPLITLRCLLHQGRAEAISNWKRNRTEEEAAVLKAMDLPGGVYAHLLKYIA